MIIIIIRLTFDSLTLLTQISSLSVHFSFAQGKYCPGTWDGWLCWPDTIAGTSAYAPCPEFVTGFDPLRKYRIFFLFCYYFVHNRGNVDGNESKRSEITNWTHLFFPNRCHCAFIKFEMMATIFFDWFNFDAISVTRHLHGNMDISFMQNYVTHSKWRLCIDAL